MKTIAKIFLLGSLFLGGFGYASAQSAASSSSNINGIENDTISLPSNANDSLSDIDTMQVRIERGLPTPPHIENLFRSGRISEALREFEKFKAENQKKTSPYNLLYSEMTIYQQAQMADRENGEQYAQKVAALRQQIISKYPNVSDTYLLQIENNTPPQKIIQLATKAIELDPENVSAYETRGNALYQIGKTKEACADFEKLPWKNKLFLYENTCKNLK